MPELPELDKILHSGNLAYGPYTKEFEKKLAEFLGSQYVLVTNSFNTAISVAVSALGLVAGDEVILSPMACLASTQPYEAENLKIIWADVDPQKGTLDPESVIKNITPKTKCIVHNHFCGYPGEVDAINEIGRKYGIPVIDDGIECFGSEYKGKKIGNCGTDITVFSFNPVRIPNTIDGGCIVFKDKELYEKAMLIRDCGIDRTKFRDEMGEIDANCDITMRGYSATMSNVNGYIGMKQMECVEKLISSQRENANKWSLLLEGSQYKPLSFKDTIPNYWVYGIIAPDKKDTIKTFRDKGYYASGVHVNNNIYSIFGASESLPGVENFYKHFVALPCGWWVDTLE